MLSDLASSQHIDTVKVPLADFTEAQCPALLAYLYNNGVSNKGAAFADKESQGLDTALAVARFANTHEAPHAFRHFDA